MLKIIAAVAENEVIGSNEEIPWRLRDDLKWFKEQTGSLPVVMGRTTFISIIKVLGRPLPGRETILLTRNSDFSFNHGATVIHDWSEIVERSQTEDIFVAGGSEPYRLALESAGELYLTRVHARVRGDTFFPDWNPDDWELVSSEHHEADERNELPFTWEVYRKVENG